MTEHFNDVYISINIYHVKIGANKNIQYCRESTVTFFLNFLKEDFIRKSAKTTLLYTYKIYTCMYIPPPATYANTIHNTT